MRTLDVDEFAEDVREAYPYLRRASVRVYDSDLCLVIQVRDRDNKNELVAQHDTDLAANDVSTEADELASRLAKALRRLGIKTRA